MADTNALIPVQNALNEGKEFMDVLLQDDAVLVCVNKSAGKKRSMRFKALYENNSRFWLQKSEWEFFFSGEEFARLRDKAEALKATSGAKPWEADHARTSAPQVQDAARDAATGTESVEPAVESSFGKEYAAIAAMSEAKRIEHINESAARLDTLIIQKPRKKELVTEALVDATRDTALINHATLRDAMQLVDEEAKKHTQELVNSTNKLIKSSTRLVSPDIFNDELMHTLVSKSNGTVIQHMTRVFLNGLAFLSYYNELVSTSSIINKLRISFDKEYRAFYQALLPHLNVEQLNLERVFQGGMRAIPENSFFTWATGFLIHDIGKAAAVEYHEGESAYDRDIVIEHVKLGYTQVMNKTNYPREAGLITGYHHEYYGDPGGYGYFRAYLEQYRKQKPGAQQSYCISYELEPMLDYQALAYFPAKALEIIDVYDSVTDPNRKYRKAMTPEEALAMMREEFTVKHHKIDLILFTLFTRFVRERLVPAA
jgi:HD-GYP domain-containing protein (c-di-GMP phosphodiesterase class II)